MYATTRDEVHTEGLRKNAAKAECADGLSPGSANKPSKLLILPTELLLAIASGLRTRDLNALVRTNKTLSKTVLPLLYERSIYLGESEINSISDNRTARYRSLLLIEPFRHLVRSIELGPEVPSMLEMWEVFPNLKVVVVRDPEGGQRAKSREVYPHQHNQEISLPEAQSDDWAKATIDKLEATIGVEALGISGDATEASDDESDIDYEPDDQSTDSDDDPYEYDSEYESEKEDSDEEDEGDEEAKNECQSPNKAGEEMDVDSVRNWPESGSDSEEEQDDDEHAGESREFTVRVFAETRPLNLGKILTLIGSNITAPPDLETDVDASLLLHASKFATLRALVFPLEGKKYNPYLHRILQACPNLEILTIGNGVNPAPSTEQREMIKIISQTVGKTLKRITFTSFFTDESDPILTPFLGKRDLFPVLKEVRVDFHGINSFGNGKKERDYLLDLCAAQKAHRGWRFAQDAGNMVFELSVDAASLLTQSQWDTLMPWLKSQVPSWDGLLRASLVARRHWDRFEEIERPVRLAYDYNIPREGYDDEDMPTWPDDTRLMEGLITEQNAWQPSGESEQERLLNAHHASDQMDQMLNFFLPECRTLKKFGLGGGRAKYRPFFSGGDTLAQLLSDLCINHSLRELYINIQALLKDGRESINSVKAFEQHIESVDRNIVSFDEYSWISSPTRMANLTHLHIKFLVIRTTKARDWFLSIPKDLAMLQELVLDGFCWEPRDHNGKRDDPLWDDEVDPRLSELVNHELREKRVLKRLREALMAAAEERKEDRLAPLEIKVVTDRFGTDKFFMYEKEIKGRFYDFATGPNDEEKALRGF